MPWIFGGNAQHDARVPSGTLVARLSDAIQSFQRTPTQDDVGAALRRACGSVLLELPPPPSPGSSGAGLLRSKFRQRRIDNTLHEFAKMTGLAHPEGRFEPGSRLLPGRMRRKKHLLSTIRDCDLPHPPVLLAHPDLEQAIALQRPEVVANSRSIHRHDVRKPGHRHRPFRGKEAQQAVLGRPEPGTGETEIVIPRYASRCPPELATRAVLRKITRRNRTSCQVQVSRWPGSVLQTLSIKSPNEPQ